MADDLESHLPSVYRFALRLAGGDRDAAADLTQEAFARAWARRHRLRDIKAGKVWMLTITRNLWTDELRRRRLPPGRAAALDIEPAGSSVNPEHVLAQHEELREVLAAMDQLPERQRQALYLNACEGMRIDEVAMVLDISATAAKASLSLARKKLREMFPGLNPKSDPIR